MIVSIFNVTVPEEAREGFERSWSGRAGMVDQMPGFRGLEVLRSRQEAGRYVVLTHWETREDFERWLESSAFGTAHQRGGQGAAQPGQTEVWDILEIGKSPQ
ncbi:MAG TPA: antibiotic biosynthesis monooxygenase [Ktedonobacterales bacterium]|jgi:heme-degrading monooxygenase HmoA|nr:antibiotic biosynthesis monooxygenase [Ktedonobacterales bacterium]